eukprot:6909262-Ditylum_brightwellii.AAC.1
MATRALITNMSTAVSVGSEVTGVGNVGNILCAGEIASVASAITGIDLMSTGGAGSIASAVTGLNSGAGENESQQSAITGIGMDGTDTPGKVDMGDKQQ